MSRLKTLIKRLMQITLLVCAILSINYSTTKASSIVERLPAKNDNIECPDWVKREGMCKEFRDIVSAALKYADILGSEYEIIDAKANDEILYVIVRRGHLIAEIEIGKLEGLKSAQLIRGELVLEFERDNCSLKDKAYYGISGGVIGLILGIIFL